MSKLNFYHSCMDSGKSLDLIRTAYNYELKGMKYLAFNAAIDTRFGEGVIASRAGVSIPAIPFTNEFDFIEKLRATQGKINVILIDEAQFLSEKHVEQLCYICDSMGIPVVCYGLRADRHGKLFPGSSALFAHGDSFKEIKSICKCGRKATHNKCNVEAEGQVLVGDDIYEAVCRKCFFNRDI